MLDLTSVLVGSASMIVWIGVACLAVTCASLLVAIPALVLAQRAERPLEAALRAAAREVDPILDELAQIRSPSGTRFFSTRQSRFRLARELVDLRVGARFTSNGPGTMS